MIKIAIFGATGVIGQSLAQTLSKRRVAFRVVGRSREKLDRLFGSLAGAEPCVADLATAEGAKAASEGVDTIAYCVGVPYETAAFAQLPRQTGVVLDET